MILNGVDVKTAGGEEVGEEEARMGIMMASSLDSIVQWGSRNRITLTNPFSEMQQTYELTGRNVRPRFDVRRKPGHGRDMKGPGNRNSQKQGWKDDGRNQQVS